MADDKKEERSLALTPTWSVASVLTVFVVVSLLVERSIHRLSNVSLILYVLDVFCLTYKEVYFFRWALIILICYKVFVLVDEHKMQFLLSRGLT